MNANLPPSRDPTRRGSGSSSSAPSCFRLRSPSAEIPSLQLPSGSLRIGRHAECDVRIDRPGISRSHAFLEVRSDHVAVIDAGSKNGVRVNGHAATKAEIEPGDRVSFGPVDLILEEVAEEDRHLALSFGEVADEPAASTPAPTPSESLGSTFTEPSLDAHWAGSGWQDFCKFLEELSRGPRGHAGALTGLKESLGLEGLFAGEIVEGTQVVVVTGTGELDPDDGRRIAAEWKKRRRGTEPIAIRSPGVAAVVCSAWGAPRLIIALGAEQHVPADAVLSGILAASSLRWPLRDRQAREAVPGRVPELWLPDCFVTGTSEEMERVFRRLRPIADTDIPVLISGETGTGKEYIAEILHYSSRRGQSPLIAINCAAIPADLLEAELFGIGKAVATGVAARPGKFRLADGGTLFLDEIGEMPKKLQAKLLRVLEQGEVEPVGGQPERVDVRLVAATNVDLDGLSSSGALRMDFYYRLAGCAVELPPLRRRREDIPIFIERFAHRTGAQIDKQIRGFTIGAMRALVDYRWPGNIRELKHETTRLVHVCPEGQPVTTEHLDPRFLAPPVKPVRSADDAGAEPPPTDDSETDTTIPVLKLEELERAAVEEALESCRWRVGEAARRLGISRHALKRRMKKYELYD